MIYSNDDHFRIAHHDLPRVERYPSSYGTVPDNEFASSRRCSSVDMNSKFVGSAPVSLLLNKYSDSVSR